MDEKKRKRKGIILKQQNQLLQDNKNSFIFFFLYFYTYNENFNRKIEQKNIYFYNFN